MLHNNIDYNHNTYEYQDTRSQISQFNRHVLRVEKFGCKLLIFGINVNKCNQFYCAIN